MKADISALDFAAGETKDQDFLALNPNGMVPVLVDGDITLWESNAINLYLVEKAGGSSLFPQNTKVRADIVRWQFWEVAHFNRAFGTLVFEGLIKPKFGMEPPSDGLVSSSCRSSVALRRYSKAGSRGAIRSSATTSRSPTTP